MDLEDKFIQEANERHDREHPNFDWSSQIKSAWNETRLSRRKPLTDKKIQKYIEQGYYSAEYRKARKELQVRKAKAKRVGNFIESEPGKFVYAPL